MKSAGVFLLGFLLGFSVDVKVEAAERVQLIGINVEQERLNPNSSALLEEPKNCLKEEGLCALRVGERRKFVYKPSERREWTLAEKSVVVRIAEDRLRFIEGSIRIIGDLTTIETEQGSLVVRGEAFVDRKGEKLTVVNTGQVPIEFTGRGWPSAQEIPSGLEAHIDLPSVKNGRASVNLPLPLDYDNQVVREARLYQGKKEDFAKRLEEIQLLRTEAAAVSASLHQEMVERKIASIEAKEKANREIRGKREARDKELRALFRKKVLNPE